jgi:hypothetical protein
MRIPLASLALAALALAAFALDDASHPAGRAAAVAPPPREVEVFRLREAAKLRVVAQVMAGGLDLFGAAAHFRQINHEPPELVQIGYRRLPGATDEEKLCREVILWVRSQNPGRAGPGEAGRIVAELEDALEGRYGPGPAMAPAMVRVRYAE